MTVRFGFGKFGGAYRQRRYFRMPSSGGGSPYTSEKITYGKAVKAGFLYSHTEESTYEDWYYVTARVHADPDTSGLDPEDLRKIIEGWTTEPAAADASEYRLRVELAQSITVPLLAGVKTSAYSGTTDSALFAFCGGSGFFSDPLAAGETEMTWTATRTQAKNIALYGIKVSPPTIFNDGTATMPSYSQIADAWCEVVWKNPAARGKASAFSPASYSAIIGSAATAVTFVYSHELGGYSAGLLTVNAVNLGTGERVQICRKASVTIADGGTGTFTIPAEALGEGTWELTVCVCPAASASYYGDSDAFWETGEKVRYNVRANPSTSVVTTDGRPIPKVFWESTDQASYQLRVGNYDSGVRSGTNKNMIVPKIFPDGVYNVQYRIGSSDGSWSDWSDPYYVELKNHPPSGTFTASAEPWEGNVRVSWAAYLSAVRYAIFRDGVMIGTTTGTSYIDRTGGGEYEVLAVTAQRYYRTSGKITAWPRAGVDLISADGGLTWIPLKYTPARKSQPESRRREIAYYYYAGREKPVAVDAGQTERTISYAYIFKNREAARAVEELIGREVILKSARGEVIRGIIGQMDRTGEGRLPVTLTFSIRELDGEEESAVEYPV